MDSFLKKNYLRSLQFNELERPPFFADVGGVPEYVRNNVLLPIHDPVRVAELEAPAVRLVAGALEFDLRVDHRHVSTDQRR